MKTFRHHRKLLGWFMTWLMVVSLPSNLLRAENWVPVTAGPHEWSNPANWSPATVPNAVNAIAILQSDLLANQTINLATGVASNVTLGTLTIGDLLGTGTMTLASGIAGSNLVFDVSAGAAALNKYNGNTDTIQTGLILNDNLAANIFAGTLDVNGVANAQVSYTGSGNTIKNGAGVLRLNLNTDAGYTGNWVVNFGTLNVGGVNGATPTSLGTGTGGINLLGTGRADLAIFSLNNNGSASDGLAAYTGNTNVNVRGGATINVDRNYIGGANDRVTHVLGNLNFNGGILRSTSGNSHMLRFDGTTTLGGGTNVFDVAANAISTQANITLQGTVTGTGGIIKEGAGRLKLTSLANNYTGPTAVKDGVLELGSGAKTGTGITYVNGGTLSVQSTATLNNVSANGLAMVGQLGTSRFALPVLGYNGFINIDSSNPLNFNVPIAGAILGIDGVTGTSSVNTANIDLDFVAGGSERVWLGNVPGFDRTYAGVLTNSSNSGMGPLRLTAGSSNFFIGINGGDANRLGGDGAMNGVIFGFDHQNAIGFTGNNVTNAAGGTISVRVDNSASLGAITVNRGVTVNINGAVFTPLGNSAVTMLGGAMTTDNASLAQFGNTDFRLYGGSTLTLDNRGVAGTNTDRRLQATTAIALTSSTLNFASDGGAAGISTQNLASLSYSGGNVLNIGRDGAVVGSRADLILGALTRSSDPAARGTLQLRQLDAQAATLGTGSATSRILVSSGAPTPTNGMVGANLALWGGANMQDSAQPLFVTYDGTNGFQAAGFDVSATTLALLQGATAGQIVNFDAVAGTQTMTANASMQALRLRTTANTQLLNSPANFAITLGSTGAVGQGAGLFLAHTADNEVTHTANFTFGGGQEGMIYVATPGGSAFVRLNGNITGSNGLTVFGDGRLRLGGANNFGGPLTINSGDVRLTGNQGAGLLTGAPTEINMWGGIISLAGSTRHNNNITFFNDARISNDNAAGAAFNNLTVEARTGSTAPVVFWAQNVSGGNSNTAFGGLTLNGDARFSVVHTLQINGAISGTGNLEKHMNERLYLGGDSSGYLGSVTAYAGSLQSLNANSTAKPFGSGAITINPGSTIRLAAPSNINGGQLTLNSDLGGISVIGMSYVGDPASIPAFTVNSTAPWKGTLGIGAFGFSQNIDQATLWGGDFYLGSSAPGSNLAGDTGVYTGTLSPAAGNKFLLGTGQGTIRMGSTLSGSGTSAIIGVSMSGNDLGRAGQAVNNSGGTVQYDVPMTYTGNTIINPNNQVRVSSRQALTATGDIYLNGGTLQADNVTGQSRMIAPLTVSNNIVLTSDSALNIQNEASDLRLTGTISLSPGVTGAVRNLFLGVDQPGAAANNAGNVYADGGIIDGAGGSGNHLTKNGAGTLFFSGINTFSGSLTVNGGLVAVNSNADFGNITSINLPGGGLAIWENSFDLTRNISMHGGNGWFDVLGGLTLTQNAASTFDGTSFVMKRGLGTMVLNGTNAQTGLVVADGVLQINNQAALGNPAEAGAAAIQLGGDFSIGSGANNNTRYTGGTFRVNFTGATNRGITFNNNGNTGFSGGIDVTAGNILTLNGAISQGTEFDFGFLTGTGTLVTTGANTWRQLAVTDGTLQFSNNTPWANSTGTAADNTIIELLGGTIRAVNTGANIALANAASTTTYNYGGGTHLRMGSGPGFSVEFAADNLIRVNQGTLVIETEGSTLLGRAGATDAARLIVTNAVNPGVARGTALTNGIFAPHLLGANSSGTAYFLQDNAATGFEAYSGISSATLSGLNPTGIGDIVVNPSLTGTNNSIYAFRTSTDISGGTLRVRAVDNQAQGGIVINGSNTISSNLIFDPTSATAPGTGTVAEGLVYVKTGENATIGGNITSNSFTKFGRGTLTLAGSNSIVGELSVQDGMLRLSGSNPLSVMNSELNLNAGAVLDLNGTRASVETLGNNNRTVTAQNAQIGGTVTNLSGTQARLEVASPINSVYNGTLDLNLRLVKAGAGTLTLNGYSSSSPNAGNNTYTGGTDIYGVNTTGGITLNNSTYGLGGFGGSSAGAVNLYSGTLSLFFSNGNTGINGTHGQHFSNQVIKIGAEAGDGITLNVNGPGMVNVNVGNVSSNTQWGRGNILQVGAMNVTNTTLNLNGGNFYRFRVAGPTAILGSQITFNTASADGPSGALELFGQITGTGAINKTGDGILRGIVIANPANTYSGGTNIIAGDVQVTATSGSALGTGDVRVFPDGTLRIAGNGSVDGSKLTVMSRVGALGAVMLDDNFAPTVLNGTNFSSVYDSTLQLGVPYFNQALNLATIGDGRAFLGTGLSLEGKYMAATLGAGVADTWNPGVGVYRLVGGVNNLAFDGADNVLTGGNYVQVGPRRNMVLGAATNTGNAVFVRNTNDYSGGTQITEATVLIIETGGSPGGAKALGAGAIEVYGELRVQNSLGSLWDAGSSSASNTIQLRPSGLVRLIDGNINGSGGNLVAGGQGRWGDAVGIDLNGGQFRFDGAANWNSFETIGDVSVRKGGIITVARNSTASSAQLNVGNIDRIDGGTLTINYNAGFLGTNLTTPLSYERLVATQIDGVAVSGAIRGGTTLNGATVINGGMVAPWIIDQVANTFVGYNPTGTGTGFQPLLSTATPGAGEISYNKIVAGALTVGGLVSGDIADITTVAKTLADNPTLHALRSNQNISPTALNNTMTIQSGGWIMNGGTINPTGAVTAGVVSPMTLNFGAGGAGEAIIYVGTAAATVQAQMVAAQGLTKFGGQTLTVTSISPGIDGPVTINAGTIVARVPFSGTGTPLGAGNGVFGGQDIILNGGGLQLDPFMANATGTATEIASFVRATATFDSNIFVRGDANLNNNGQANFVRISNLTFQNGGGAAAMNGNGVIALALQSGIWVGGTTTLIPQAVFNQTVNSGLISTFAGQVTGAADLEKFGNGTIALLNGTNNYSGGTTIWAAVGASQVSTVASAFRGVGTPFGTGPVTVNPGALLRITDAANIAGNAVTLKSDGFGLAGLGIGHNGALPTIITSGTPLAGQVKIESTGAFAGVIGLDYGYYSRSLDMAAIPGGNWWLGGSLQQESYYFNGTLGAAANGKYLLGGGGASGAVNFGSVSIGNANTRTPLFENLFTGGTANTPRIEVGALTADLFANGPSLVNGNSAFITMVTRNTGLVGDTRVNTNTTLSIGNNFALGSGRLVLNGGGIRADFGPNNAITANITLNNNVLLQGDFNTNSGGEIVLNGNVAMHDGGAGATRLWNLTQTTAMAVGLTAGSSTNGVISGADGSNLIKNGVQFVSFRAANTYQGYTQINQGQIVVTGDVMPGVAGPLGNSTSAIILAAAAANAGGGLSIGGKYTIGRDILVSQVNGTGTSLIENRTNETAVVTGGISVITGATLALGGLGLDNTNGRGGVLEIRGPVSGAGVVQFGTVAAAPNANGPVALTGNSNGFGINTYSGGSVFQTTRVQIGSNTLFGGPVSAPTLISGPLGIGNMTWTSGEAGNGFSIEAIGGSRTIVNGFNATSSAANSVVRFMGHEALTFTRDWNMNSDGTLRNRVIVTNNLYQPMTFSGNLSNSGGNGSNFIKQGPGLLVLTGTNTQANLNVSDGNYGTGVFIDSGILRVNGDAALGSTAPLAAAGPHLVGPADIRLRGGVLSVSSGFTTARQLILVTAAGGIDVAAGQTLTLSTQTAGALGLTKTGPGTLALNNIANTITALTLGGAQQINPTVGLFSHTGGTVSTTATSGTPFATASVTINSGALSLVGGAVAQALSIPTLNYGAAGAIALNAGATSSQLTVATAFARQNTFNSVNYGTLTLNPSVLANLGTTEKVIVTTGAPVNTTLGAGTTLTTPSVFVALAGSGRDANFARYDAVNGLMEHNATLSTTLGVTAPATLANITTPDTVGAAPGAIIDVFGVRTNVSIGAFDPTTRLQINGGGLIINGATASTLSANTLFGTGTAVNQLAEGIVYVRDGQTGTSAISGNITARDFTKTGPGVLELSGSANVLNASAVVATPSARLPVLSVQDGTLRFASAGARFTNSFRPADVVSRTGGYVLNVNEAGIFDLNGLATTLLGGLTGNGTVTSLVAGNANLRVSNGFGVDPTFRGLIGDGAGSVSLTKSGNGVLILGGHGSFTGGTTVEAGRVTNATGASAATGALDVRSVTALGNGPITLAGGTLTINANVLDSETRDGFTYNLFGGANGADVTVASIAYSNGVALPANATSLISLNSTNTAPATGVSNVGVNTLTVNAPLLSLLGPATAANRALLYVQETTTFTQDTVLRTTGRAFLALGGRIDAAGRTITKIGFNGDAGTAELVVTNTESGAGQNSVGLWKVYGGILNARAANGASNPLGSNVTVEINGGSTNYGLLLNSDGDGTLATEIITTYADTNLRFGSLLGVSSNEFVSSGAGRIQIDRVIGNNDDKTFQVNNLEVGGVLGSPYVFVTGGSGANLFVKGTTTFTRDLFIQNDLRATLNGLISGNGTFVKRASADLFINFDNTSGYKGGTVLGSSGTTIFGSLEGNQITLNSTAKLGGQVLVNPNARLLINGTGNVQTGQTFAVGGNLSNYGVLGIGSNDTLDAIGYRALGAGGIQNGSANYYTSASNPSGSVLAINTVYSQVLDQRAMGNGMGFIGSTTNYVGANGLYDAATLLPGTDNAYRLGAGGATLFVGLSNANVLTNRNAASPSSLVIGAPFQANGNNAVLGNGSGTVVLLGSNNYTGATIVNRLSTLDFRGTLATSGIENYGNLHVAGEAGTFIGSGAVLNRPGSLLRFDNYSAGVLPVSATQGRWADGTALALNNSTVRMQGNSALETQETVGAISTQGGSFIEIVRGVHGRTTEIRTPGITRVNSGTIQFNTNTEQLGTDEKFIITGAAPAVTNGMVAPWMVTNTNSEFLTYNADTGFTKAGFTRNQAAATLAATVSALTDRTIFSGAVVLNDGIDFETWGLRLDGDVTLTTATNSTAQLIIGSGGLLTTGTRIINSGIVAGSIASPGELLLWNSGTTTIGDPLAANRNTSGQILGTSLTKFGAGQLNLSAQQQTFNGNIRVQQGQLVLRYANGTETDPVSTAGGVGSIISMEGPNTTLFFRGGQDGLTGNVTFNNSVVLGDFNPLVQIDVDRQGGTITNRRNIIANNFTFGANNLETGQILRYVGTNAFDLQIGSDATDFLTLVGKSTFNVVTSTADLFVAAKTTGAGTLVMGGGAGLLQLSNVTNLNDFSGGTVVMGSTLQVFAKANNVAANASTQITAGGLGAGDITLLGGTLSLLVDNDVGGAADTNLERTRFGSIGNGPNLIVNGAATLNVDRTGLVAAGTTKQIGLNNLTIGSQILTVSGGNAYGVEITGTTTMLGNMFVNTGTDFVLNGAIGDGGAGLFINKIGVGTLWIGANNNTATSPNGGIFVQAGRLDFGDRLAVSGTASLGVGRITINPGAEIVVRGLGNVNTGAGQKVVLNSTPYAPAVFLPTIAPTQAQLLLMLQSSTPTSNENQILAYNANYAAANDYDQSSIGNGRVFFGNNGNISFTGTGNGALVPGLANLANSVIGGTSTNLVYRLGGRTQNTLTVDLAGTGNLNDVGGATDLQIGSLANFGPSANWGLGQVLLADQNTYTGQTIVSRSSILRFSSVATATAGPLGGLTGGFSTAAINVYGTLQVEGNGSFRDVGGTANAYSNINLRPGSSLIFLNNNATTNSNRWDNGTAINLDGARFTLDAQNAVDLSAETVGAINFDRGARIQTVNEGTSEILLTAASVGRAAASGGAGTGRGTMVFTPASSANLGLTSATNNAEQVRFTVAPTASAVSAVAGMLPGFYIEGTGNRFVTHNATNGITPIADGSMVAFTPGMTAGTAVVNVTAAVNLPDFNPSIYALRIGAFALGSPTGANNDATITLGGSGADVGGVLSIGASTIHPNLTFGASGTNEALIYAAGNITFTGNLRAGGVTKFGTAQLIVSNDQSDAARGNGIGYQNGWVVNEGSLLLSTFGSAGNNHVNNTIVLNANQSSNPTLFLRANPADSLLNYTYSSGRIIVVDNGTIDYDPGADDRVHTIADIEIQQSGGIGNGPANGTNDAQLRIVNNRNRSILAAGQLTLTNNAILNVDSTNTGATFLSAGNNAANLTNGVSNGMSVASLTGSGRLTKWGDGTLYIRGASNNTGPVVIDQGSVFVTNNASLGSGALTVNRYGVLEIGVAGFTPSNSAVTFNEGSVERWSIDGARTGSVDLGKATLQVGADQNQTVTVTLNGGSIEGWTRTDDIGNNATQSDVGVFRNLGANVSVTLAGNSFVGNPYYLGTNGLDSGRQTNDFRPVDENIGTGATLNIQGVISGATQSLTKVGYDTVILSGASNYGGGTIVSGGTLKIGRDNALAASGSISTYANGVLDLNGFNQTVGSLTNPADVATNVSATNNGYITNSAYGIKTLTAGNAGNSTYRGVIQHNVALSKIGTGTMRVTNDNTYFGTTTVNGGILEVTGRLSGTMAVRLNTDGKLLLNSASNNIVNVTADVILDGGTLAVDNSQSGRTNSFRGLTVASDSTIDFGAGNANHLRFDSLDDLTGNLSVRGWTGALYDYINTLVDSLTATPTNDRLRIIGATGYSTNSAINKIQFLDTNGISFARGWQAGYDGPGGGSSIVPVNLATAYWKGNLASNAWDEGNWSSDLAGLNNPGIAPTGNTDIILSASNQEDQDNMVLGSDMQVKSVTVNNAFTSTSAILQSVGGYTLSVVGGNAITTDAGSSAATFHVPLNFMAANATIAVNSANPLTLNGAITATAITKTGTGLLVLNGSNAYTGGTNINQGTLRAGDANALGSTGAIDFGGGALQHSAGNTVDYSSRIVNSSAAIRIDTNAQTVTYASAIAASNTGGLAKEGAGTLILTAANNYTGTTTVGGGILLANNTSGSATGTGAVSVSSGATLGGTGTIGGPASIASGGILTVENDGLADSLDFSGSLTSASGSTWFIDLFETTTMVSDVINVGALSIGGANLSLYRTGTFNAGNIYTIANFNGGLTGTFAGLAEGAFIDGYQINYGTGMSGTITLTAVPEPGTLGLLGLALAGFFTRRIRRRRAEAALVRNAQGEE